MISFRGRQKSRRDPFLGKQIGPYRIERELGHGGMSVVYLAVRDDKEFQQRVALKLIKRGMDTDEILQRFRQERQTLAALHHPNIARLFDGGTTNDGLPYFVMEYIDGLPIQMYCDSHSLNTRQRLTLFRTVCSAVHYAHQNLVIPRDIKPANILVTAEGEPKLLDFGIAKVINPELAAQSIELTGDQMHMMTPEYASPEQIRGAPITTASDVYSLGVLLYELLTGHRPYRFESLLRTEIERIISAHEPEKPSTIISRVVEIEKTDGTTTKLTPESVSATREGWPGRLKRRLVGDLDNIVMMALRKEPERRYTSVEQLSEDIQRHLRGLTVSARKDTVSYRSSKFIRRHKIGLAALTLVLLSLMAAVVGISWQARKTNVEARKARQMVTYLKKMLSVMDPFESGREVTVAKLLDAASERIDTELRGQPEIEAEIRSILGAAYQNLGFYAEAEPHVQKALAISRLLHGQRHPEVAARLHALALLRHYQGAFENADSLYRQSIAMHRQFQEKATPAFVNALNDYGLILIDLAKYDSSASVLEESLAINRLLFGETSGEVGVALNNLAVALDWKGERERAEKFYRNALDVYQQVYSDAHIDVAKALNNLAWIVLANGDTAQAAGLWQESLAMRRNLLGEGHPDVALALHNLAMITYFQKDYVEAEALERQAVAIWEKLLTPNHPSLIKARLQFGKIEYAKGEFGAAEKTFREVLVRNATFRR